jgi:cytochrome c-550 PedF
MSVQFLRKVIVAILFLGTSPFVSSHGNVTPQGVDTGTLPELGSEPLAENPFREGGEYGDMNAEAVAIGESGYAGNCAACHGIQAMSGGMTPDLRELTNWDDEYFIGRVMKGYGNMPSFKDTLDQNAMWAIKTYVESLPQPE